ncbi:MAG: PP2C family protein-serine/threonine phosphatase [candidate division Zixibacteria bacterium]|nr:PP2C family protein-serine/threonine phosphatase [candidate division Zixibacteria bacterium]
MLTSLDYQNDVEVLEAKLASQKAELRDIATMGAVIASIHEIDAVLSVVMDMTLRLLDGEVGFIMLEEDERLKLKTCWGVNEEFITTLKHPRGADLATYCHTYKEAVILHDLKTKSADTGIKIDSVIVMPIKTRDKCYGVLVIINKIDGDNFSADDSERLEMLLNFVAVAIDNSQLVKDKLRQQHMEQEMVIAGQVQSTILPRDITSISGAEIATVYYPAREVGGDFYDIIKISDKKFYVIVGDVSNKGVPAALVMSASSGIIKSILSSEPNIQVGKLAERLNNLLAREIIKEHQMFVTLFFCMIDLQSERLTYCNAGHIPGLLWDSQNKRVDELSVGGPIVGQFEGIPFEEGTHVIKSGDGLFLFTDGLTEATDRYDNLFGRERVVNFFRDEIIHPPAVFCDRLKKHIDQFSEGSSEENHDDFTLVQIRIE